MAEVAFDQATRIYAAGEMPAVDGLSLQIRDGEFMVLVGPSGSGKSTALRMVAGLEPLDCGTVHVGERDVTLLPPQHRDIAMVFQDYALYPHMTVAQNMGFALRIGGVPASERQRRVRRAAEMLDLQELLRRRPKQLSGGQRQRVAMGRAIVREPAAFLLDEPLSNLDAKLRVQTRAFIASLQRELGTTTIYVTHDQVEAMTMGDRVAVLKDGILQQVDTPREVYKNPVNTFVAGFLGSPPMNLLETDVRDGVARLGSQEIPVRHLPNGAALPARVIIGVRPEHVRVVPAERGLPVTVALVEELGSDAYVQAFVGEPGRSPELIARSLPDLTPRPAERVGFEADVSHVHVFDAATGLRLGRTAQP